MADGAPRRSVYIPDDLWVRIQQAAADEGAKRGKGMSVSEWLREAALAAITTRP